MPTPAVKVAQLQAPAPADRAAAPHRSRTAPSLADKRPATAASRQQQARINASPQVQRAAETQALIAQSPRQQAAQLQAATSVKHSETPAPMRGNNTGLPDKLKEGVENLSGYSLDDVRVHYNSDKPAQLQAHAFAQGTDIHVASGQEQHLPHEAWHVVQQKQGRVKPTMQLKGLVNVNDDTGLEKEADAMGGIALQEMTNASPLAASGRPQPFGVVQRASHVYPEVRANSVVITSKGVASDFAGGDDAKNSGWNGVDKYKAQAKVGTNTDIVLGMVNNNYIVAQAGHVLAEQNGGLGSDSDNVFAQDGGVNNGPFRANFENPMRKQLNAADKNDKVNFRVVLYGDNIKKGPLSKNGDVDASDEETDFEAFTSSSSDSDSDNMSESN